MSINGSIARLAVLCETESPGENISLNVDPPFPENVEWNWQNPSCLVVPELFMSTQDEWTWMLWITAGFIAPIVSPYFLSCCLFGCNKTDDCKRFLQITYYIIVHLMFWGSAVWLFYLNTHCKILVFQLCIPTTLQTINICVVIMLTVDVFLAWAYGCYINCHLHTNVIEIPTKSVRQFLQQLEHINPTITLQLTCHSMQKRKFVKTLEENIKFSVSRSKDFSDGVGRIGKNSVVRVKVIAEPGDENAAEYLSWEKRNLADTHSYYIDSCDYWEIQDKVSVGDVKNNCLVFTTWPLWAKPHFQLLLTLFGLDPINRMFEWCFRKEFCIIKKWYMDKRAGDCSPVIKPGHLSRPNSLPVIHSIQNYDVPRHPRLTTQESVV